MKFFRRVTDEEIFFDVGTCPIFYERSGEIVKVPHRVGIMRLDREEIMHVASNIYTVVQHKDVVTNARSVLDGLGLEYTQKLQSGNDGARLFMECTIPSIQVDIGDGDLVDMRLVFNNSYDGGKSVIVDLGGYRIICTNGMVIGKSLFRVKRKHTGDVKTKDMISQVEKAIYSFTDVVAPYWRELAAIDVPMGVIEERLEEAVEAKVLPMKFAQRSLKAAQSEAAYEASMSLWNLLNGFTEVATHEVAVRSYTRAQQLGDKAESFVRGIYSDHKNMVM